jgi:hypothetical protein
MQDLALEDFGKQKWIKDTITKANRLVSFVRRHQFSHAMFKEISQYELLRPGATRFATNFIMLQRLLITRDKLGKLVMSNAWRGWDKSGSEDGVAVKGFVVSDAFWDGVEKVVLVMEPLVKVLKLADGRGGVLGEIYSAMLIAEEELVNVRERVGIRKVRRLEGIFRKRWDNMVASPLHAVGYLLNPKWQTEPDLHLNGELSRAWDRVVDILVPHDEQEAIDEQYLKFRNLAGPFGENRAIRRRESIISGKMSAADYWFLIGNVEGAGDEVGGLKKLAIRILSQCSSASDCERNWSLHEAIQTKKRNRLGVQKLEDLVYTNANLHLLQTLESGHTKKKEVMHDGVILMQQREREARQREEEEFPLPEGYGDEDDWEGEGESDGELEENEPGSESEDGSEPDEEDDQDEERSEEESE